MVELATSRPASLNRLGSARDAAPAARRRTRRLRLPIVTSLCFVWIVGLTLTAVFAPLLAPHDPLQQNLMARNLPPGWISGGTWDHPFATDQIGYDLFSRTLYGARPALQIGA